VLKGKEPKIKLILNAMKKTKDRESIVDSPVPDAMLSESVIPIFDTTGLPLDFNVERHFKLSWGLQLKAITAGISCLLVGISVYSFWQMLNTTSDTSLLGALMPLVIIVLCSFFTVRGYSISKGQLIIHRLGWSHTIELSGLISASFEPGVMQGSLRTFANGGLFAFAGNFYDSNLGAYRAYVTDGMKSVVLRFSNQTLVISPSEPFEFITAVMSEIKFRKQHMF
jgi:hypothetical protein